MSEIFQINSASIEPGQDETIKLNVARLPSGTRIYIHVHVYRSSKPGPTCLVLGGIHGDEINGVEIVRRAVASNYFKRIERGSVIAIPLLNIYGFINFSRETHDGKDVNRSFPGTSSGSLSSRVARSITKEILPLVNFGLDFHTGSRSIFNYPQIRYTPGHEESIELAKAFGAPLMVAKSALRSSLRKVALKQDIPVIVYEGGESLRLDGFAIEKGQEGILRVLKHKGMISTGPPEKHSLDFVKTTWQRAAKSGMFTWTQSSGTRVSEGEPLGYIHDPYGQHEHVIRAKRSGYIIGHNNSAVVSQGDALFHIGY